MPQLADGTKRLRVAESRHGYSKHPEGWISANKRDPSNPNGPLIALAERIGHKQDWELSAAEKLAAAAQKEAARVANLEPEPELEVAAATAVYNPFAGKLRNSATDLRTVDGTDMQRTSSGRKFERRTEPEALLHMKRICENWQRGHAALLEWDGQHACESFQACQATADALDQIKPTDGYAGVRIQLGQAKAELQRCADRAQKEYDRNQQLKELTRKGNEELTLWKAEQALESFQQAEQLVQQGFLKFSIGKVEIVRTENESERRVVDDCLDRAEEEKTRQTEVKQSFAECVKRLEENKHHTAHERCGTMLTSEAAQHCMKAAQICQSTAGALLSQCDTPEYQALAHVQDLCQSWKAGDASLKSWQGQDAYDAYTTAQQKAEQASLIMNQPTPGYMGDKIELSAIAKGVLRQCIAEAKKEIDRKKRFNDHVSKAEDHLQHLRASLCLSEIDAGRRVHEQCNEGLFAEESTLIAELQSKSEAERLRQTTLKQYFTKACHGLAGERFETKETDPIQYCEMAIECALQTTDLIVSQNDSPEHQALVLMKKCCEQWKQGDSQLRAWDGRRAQNCYQQCQQLATKAAKIPPTRGYEGAKIELDDSAQAALKQCLQKSEQEIARKDLFQDTIIIIVSWTRCGCYSRSGSQPPSYSTEKLLQKF